MLYTTWGLSEHRPNSCALSPQFGPSLSTFCGSNLVTCKVMRPDFRSRCSWGEIIVKRINLSLANNRNIHYPTDEPNPTHVESLGRGNALLDFFKPAWGLMPKLCHLGRHMGWVSVWVHPSIKPLGRIWWNRRILFSQIFRVWAGPQSGPKYKMGQKIRSGLNHTPLKMVSDLHRSQGGLQWWWSCLSCKFHSHSSDASVSMHPILKLKCNWRTFQVQWKIVT